MTRTLFCFLVLSFAITISLWPCLVSSGIVIPKGGSDGAGEGASGAGTGEAGGESGLTGTDDPSTSGASGDGGVPGVTAGEGSTGGITDTDPGTSQAAALVDVSVVEVTYETESTSEDGSDPVEQGLNALTSVLSAILGTSTTSDNFLGGYPATTAAYIGVSTTAQSTSSSASATPTATLPISSFYACQNFANTASSCASATSSWYQLSASVQASCACYTQTYIDVGCYTEASYTTYAPYVFDGYVSSCYSYFQTLGYTQIASRISQDAIGLCATAGDVYRSANATITTPSSCQTTAATTGFSTGAGTSSHGTTMSWMQIISLSSFTFIPLTLFA